MNKTRQIIDYAYEDNGKEMRDTLYSAIHDKVMAHIESHKQVIAQNLIAQEEVEQVDEISIDTMKSAKQKLAKRAVAAHLDDNKFGARQYAGRALYMGKKIARKERLAKEEVEQND